MKFIRSLFDFSTSKTARNTYVVTLGNAFSMLFGFIFILTLVRVLSLNDFGYFSALYAMLLLVSDLADFGIGTSLSRFLPPLENAPKKAKSFLRTAFYTQFLSGLMIGFLIAIFSILIGSVLFKSQNLNFLIQITAVGIFCAIISNFFMYALSAQQRFFSAAVYNGLGGLVRLILLFFFMFLSPLTLEASVWIQTWSLLILMLTGFLFMGYSFLFVERTKDDFKKLVRFASYLGFARSITAIAGKVDVLMLVSLTTATEAGIFATASRVIGVFPLFAGSFSTVLAPKFAKVKDVSHLKSLLIKSILGTCLLVLIIAALIPFSTVFMGLLFGEKGSISGPVFRLLLLSMISFVASVPSVSLALYYLHKPQILTINSVLQVLIVIVGNFYFIPLYGRYGPAISLIIAYSVTLILTSFLAYSHLKKKLHG